MTGWQRLKRRYSAIAKSAFVAYLGGAIFASASFSVPTF